MRQFTPTLSESKAFYIEEMAKYTKASTKKAYLTRSRKALEEHHDDLVRAYSRDAQMLYGERVSRIDIRMAVMELQIIQNLYASL